MEETVTISLRRFEKMKQIENFFYEKTPCYRIKYGGDMFYYYTNSKIAMLLSNLVEKQEKEIQALKNEKIKWKDRLLCIRWYKPWTWKITRSYYWD